MGKQAVFPRLVYSADDSDAPRLKVKFDGVPLLHCFRACPDEGWAEVFALESGTCAATLNGEPWVYRLIGNVSVEREADAKVGD